MGLFSAVGSLVGGAVDVATSVVKTGVSVIDLNSDGVVDNGVESVEKSIETVADTIESLFEDL